MENGTVYKSLSKPISSIESMPIRIATFIFEQRKMILPNEKLNRIKWVIKPITNQTDYRVVTFVNRLCKMMISTGKKCIVRKRVPNPIPMRVVTLSSKDVSDRNRQKLRFYEF